MTTPESETPTELAARQGVTVATVRAWINSGVGIGSRRVKLLATRVGGRWRITAEAWEAFTAACNPNEATPVPESATARARRFARDKAETERILNG